MAFKMLKDAGYVPHEVMLMREIAALRSRLARRWRADPALAALRRRGVDLSAEPGAARSSGCDRGGALVAGPRISTAAAASSSAANARCTAGRSSTRFRYGAMCG